MRLILIAACIWMASTSSVYAQKQFDTTYAVPSLQFPVLDFSVDSLGIAYLPVNGGIYCPQLALWFNHPSKGLYTSSVMTNLSDKSFYNITSSANSSELCLIKIGKDTLPHQIPLASLPKGVYHFFIHRNTFVVWGLSEQKYKIGVITKDGVRWLAQYKERITDVELNKNGEIFFATENVIMNLNTLKPHLKMKSKIYGFGLDEKENFVISTEQGVFYQKGNSSTFALIATGLKGPLEIYGRNIYVVSNSKNLLWQITLGK